MKISNSNVLDSVIRRLSRPIVEAFVYMWHTEAKSCFDAHLGTVPKYFCSRKGDQWRATITLRYWTPDPPFGFVDQPIQDKNALGFEEQSPITLPENSGDKFDIKLFPGSSSIVLSTNAFGDFGQCSVISDIVRPDKAVRACEIAQEIWQKFIHQPQSARCLIYLVLLGYNCEAAAEEYEKAAYSLSQYIEKHVRETSDRSECVDKH